VTTTAEHEARAIIRNLRVSPQKLNLVAALIRNKKVGHALNILSLSKKRIAHAVQKGLESAIANAENNHALDIDALVVTSAFVGKGPVMTRFHARAKGRGVQVKKPFSHLTLVVREARKE
jgi:large subunit ribosomal protein L22